jgi:hypothetical protein
MRRASTLAIGLGVWSFLIRSSISGSLSTPFSMSSSTRAFSVSMFE